MVGENVSFSESGRTRVRVLTSRFSVISSLAGDSVGEWSSSFFVRGDPLISKQDTQRHGGERVYTRWSGRVNSVEISRIISFKAFNQCPPPRVIGIKFANLGVRLLVVD